MEFDQSKIETKLTEEIMLIFSELGKDKVSEIIKLNTHQYNIVYSHVHKTIINRIKELEAKCKSEYQRGIEDGKIIAEHGTTMYQE